MKAPEYTSARFVATGLRILAIAVVIVLGLGLCGLTIGVYALSRNASPGSLLAEYPQETFIAVTSIYGLCFIPGGILTAIGMAAIADTLNALTDTAENTWYLRAAVHRRR